MRWGAGQVSVFLKPSTGMTLLSQVDTDQLWSESLALLLCLIKRDTLEIQDIAVEAFLIYLNLNLLFSSPH